MKNARYYISTFTDPFGICDQVAHGVHPDRMLNLGQQHKNNRSGI